SFAEEAGGPPAPRLDPLHFPLIGFASTPEVFPERGAMAELPTTRPSLLVRIRDAQDMDAWRQFVQVYGPVVYNYGRKHGLQDADAADLAQEVLRAVSPAVGRLDYDRRRGSFSGWLFTLAHHKLHDLLARHKRHGRGSGESGVQARL